MNKPRITNALGITIPFGKISSGLSRMPEEIVSEMQDQNQSKIIAHLSHRPVLGTLIVISGASRSGSRDTNGTRQSLHRGNMLVNTPGNLRT